MRAWGMWCREASCHLRQGALGWTVPRRSSSACLRVLGPRATVVSDRGALAVIILGIDPGPERSGVCLYDAEDRRVVMAVSEADNHSLLSDIPLKADRVFIEMIHNQGRTTVGQETFETCVWVGRFMQACKPRITIVEKILRSKVKMALCGTMRAKDANIRASLLDRFGPGKEKAIGTKKNPGPLFGVTGHAWQALAVIIAGLGGNP